MIIEMLLNAIYNVFKLLTTPINIPDLPADAFGYVNQFFDYMVMGAGILANYTPFDYLMIIFGILLAVDVGIMLYHFVMWILKKIPMLGIE